MKKILIKNKDDYQIKKNSNIKFLYLIDYEKNIIYKGKDTIGSYFETVSKFEIENSHFISNLKFNQLLELNFEKDVKDINTLIFIKKFEIEEFFL
jgi:hypothetical protein